MNNADHTDFPSVLSVISVVNPLTRSWERAGVRVNTYPCQPVVGEG